MADTLADIMGGGAGRSHAEYAATLSEPGSGFSQGVGAAPPLSQAIGGTLSGLADIFAVGLKAHDEDMLKTERVDLTNKLNTYVQANSQGKMTRDAMLARSSADLVSAINRTPRFADDLRKTAQDNLGLNPQAAQVSEADWKHQASQKFQVDLAGAAVKAGIYVAGENGEIDIDKSAEAGQLYNMDQAKQANYDKAMERRYKEAETARLEAGTPLTAADKDQIEFKAAHTETAPMFNQFINSGISRFQGFKDKIANMPEAEARQALLQGINRDRLNMSTWLGGWKNNTNLSSKTYEDLDKLYNSYYDQFEKWASGPASDFEMNIQTLKSITTNHGIEFHQAAPTVSAMIDVFGPNAAQDVARELVTSRGSNLDAMTTQTGNWLGSYLNASKVGSGTLHIGSIPDQGEQKDTLDRTLAAIDNYTNRSNNLDDKEVAAYGNSAASAIRLALETNDPDQMINAQQRLATPQSIEALHRLASDPTQAKNAQAVGQGMFSLNRAAIIGNVSKLGDLTTAVGFTNSTPVNRDAGLINDAHLSPVYNPSTGKIEVINKTVGTSATVPPDIQAKVNQMNLALNNAVKLKEYGSDNEKAMKDNQLKFFIMSGTNMPLRPGTEKPEMPGDKKPDTTAGVKFKKTAAAAVQKVESNDNPAAVSPKGAVGLMQTMPNTLMNPGFGVSPAKDDSPAELQRVGQDYLRALEKHYDNPTTALAAYNWGPGNIDKWLQRGAKWGELPQETKDYVSRVMFERFK